MPKAHILVCEDDPIQSRMLVDILHRAGHAEVGPFSRPHEAAQAARAAEVDAALLDVTLEGGTVAEAAMILSERSVPFAFLTGYGPETAPIVSAHPDRLTIPKPVDPDLVHTILETLFPAKGTA